MNRFTRTIGVPLVAFALLATAACSAPSASPEPGEDDAPLKLGFVVHVLGDPFIQQIIDGAKAAAADENIDLQVTGPTGGDADAQLQAIQNLVASGVQGIATSVPAESMASGLNQLVADGIPVVQFNLLVSSVNAPYVGEASAEAGRTLATKVLGELGGEDATGDVILGNCFPGFPVLESRAAGVQEVFAEQAPGISVLGPFDVKVAANENYAAWEALLAANPGAKALIGLCAPDITSLGILQEANPDTKFISGGFDLTTQNLEQIKAGNAYVSLGQSAFAQGYLPVKILADAIRNGTDISTGGFINAGTEIVTADSVEQPNGLPPLTFGELERLAASPEETAAYYAPAINGYFANWLDALEPIENESK